MVDLREKVKDDRGLLKKIELAVPGFRGYRKREDLRIADSLLRTQLANQFKNVVRDIEQCREMLSKKMELDFLEDAGNLVSQATVLEAKIRHAEQGYTGISVDYRIEEDALHNLYEWDLELFSHIDNLRKSVIGFMDTINSERTDSMKQEIFKINKNIRDFTELFERRRETIAGLAVR